MNECEKKIVKPIDISVTVGESVVVTIPQQYLKNGCFLNLLFCLSKPDLVEFQNLITGTEVVIIKNGPTGEGYVLEDNTANIFYADLLKIGYCYRLKFGNNGPANNTGSTGAVAHFINLNTPCCARRYNPANTIIPVTSTEA